MSILGRVEQYRNLCAAGEDPALAAEIVDGGTMDKRRIDVVAEEYMAVVRRIGQEERVYEVIERLSRLPAEIAEAQRKVNRQKAVVEGFKGNGLAEAKAKCDMAVLLASMEAPQDGKNAEIRDRQMKLYLAEDANVGLAESELHTAETEMRYLENDLAKAQEDLDRLIHEMRAHLAIAGLQSALLNALKVSC